MLAAAINENVAVLPKAYLELVPLNGDYEEVVSYLGESDNCQTRGMHANQRFKNELMGNIVRHYFFTRRLQDGQDIFDMLHSLVEKALNVTHERK